MGKAWQVAYYADDNAEITRQITGMGLTTPLLAPHAAYTVRLEVTPSSNVPPGDTQEILVKALSLADPTRRDCVSALTIRVAR